MTSEVPKLPIPLSIYLEGIRKKKDYYDWISYLLHDAEEEFVNFGERSFTKTFKPRILVAEIKRRYPSKKLNVHNLSRSISALFHGSRLREDEDYYTTSGKSDTNYHLEVTESNLKSLMRTANIKPRLLI
jgi:hypothetical protein